MSRWIGKGIATGVRTTSFPDAQSLGEEGAASAIRPVWQSLTPVQALAAADLCPTAALEASGTQSKGELRFDAGACILCGRCTREFPAGFTRVADPRVAVRNRDHLRTTVKWGDGQPLAPASLREAADQVQQRAFHLFRRSLHIRHVDAGSCNGCESELQMMTSPYLDLHRLGLFFTPTPRHADALLVTGIVTQNMKAALLETYAAMPAPKLVIAAGACAISCGSFSSSSMSAGPLDQLLRVDAYVPGCPPTPQALLHGLLLAVERATERNQAAPDGTHGP